MTRRTISRRLAGAVAAASMALAGAAAPAGAAVLPADTTAVISGTPDLLGLLPWLDDGGSSSVQSVDRTGRLVAFSSTSDGLLAGDDDDVENIYVKDLESGDVRLASVHANGAPSHTNCRDAVISDDGTTVAFVCTGALDPADVSGASDVYARNLVTGRTSLVSRASGLGAVGNQLSFEPAINADGTFVAFVTRSTNFGDGPLNPNRVYRRELGNGDATLLMSRANGVINVNDARRPSISNDGSRVAFDTTDAFAFGDQNNESDIYVRDVPAGDLHLTSRKEGAAVVAGNGSSLSGAISGDGQSVAFSSNASDLDPDGVDTDRVSDVYRRRIDDATTQLVSVRADGVKFDNVSFAASINDDGLVVAFESLSNVVGGIRAANLQSYVNDDGTVVLVGRDGPAGPAVLDGGSPALSGDGTKVALDVDSRRAVLLRDLATGATRTVSRPSGGAPFERQGGGEGGAVSADGRFVAFVSEGVGFGLPAGIAEGVFVRDVVTGAVTLVSREDGPGGAPIDPDGFFSEVAISGDGRRVAFVHDFRDGRDSRILVRDVAAGRTFVASRGNGIDGPLADSFSSAPTLSHDGARVAFESPASNLAEGATDFFTQVFVRDLDRGVTLLVSRSSAATTEVADGPSFDPAISGDGRHVAFETRATNLAADPSGDDDVYVRDVDGGTTHLVSVTGAAAKGDGDSFNPSISRDGNRVSFTSTSTNFGEPSAGARLYVRDVAAGTLTVAGRADGAGGAAVPIDRFSDALLSADGQHVAFVAAPGTSIAPGAPADGRLRVYARDLASGTTRLVMRGTGAAGAPSFASRFIPVVGGITADGGCVTFTADGHLLPAPASGDPENVFMRVLKPGCQAVAPPAPPTPPGPAAKAAVLSGLKLKPARFFVGGRKGGTKVLFRLDKRSAVSLRFDRLLPGHRAKAKRVKGGKGKAGKCSTKVRKGKRCTVAKLAGRLTVVASRTRGGANTIAFSGKLGRKALKPGRYRLTATPLKGKARTVSFVVAKAPKPKPKGKARR